MHQALAFDLDPELVLEMYQHVHRIEAVQLKLVEERGRRSELLQGDLETLVHHFVHFRDQFLPAHGFSSSCDFPAGITSAVRVANWCSYLQTRNCCSI